MGPEDVREVGFTNCGCKISHSKTNSERYDKKCVLVIMYSTRYSCQILMKLEFFRQILEQNTQIPNFMKICPVRAEL